VIYSLQPDMASKGEIRFFLFSALRLSSLYPLFQLLTPLRIGTLHSLKTLTKLNHQASSFFVNAQNKKGEVNGNTRK